MNTKVKFTSMIAIIVTTLACGLNTPTTQPVTVETIVVETITALTVSAPVVETPSSGNNEPLTPDGTPFESAEVSFFIPNGTANNASQTMSTKVEYPYINPSFGDMPQHISISLDLYATTGTYPPAIMIFRADEYATYSESTSETINDLRAAPYTDGQPLPEGLDADFAAQVHAVSFQNGYGVRYLTQVFQNFLPVNNQDVFYYYQGITSDGKYFVQATLPISASFLAADSSDTPLPADGIPFTTDDFGDYLNAVAQKLNTADAQNFTPYINVLDEMINSLSIKGF
jgi:hypothetical protein